MNRTLFLTRVDHCRTAPIVHRFTYTTLSALVDLDRWLDQGEEKLSLDPFGLLTLRAKDYLPGQSGSVKAKLERYLSLGGIDRRWSRVELLTCPRFLGYVFNPVNFYLCYGAGSCLPELCIAEVNNTFGETHLYLAEPERERSNPSRVRFSAAKEFHVSPFFERKGKYEFLVERSETMIDVHVNLHRDGKPVFTSSICGEPSSPLSATAAVAAGLRHNWLTMPRILLHAALLRFRKKLPVITKPAPSSDWTIRTSRPSFLERAAAALLFRSFCRLRHGALRLILPDGQERLLGAPEKSERTACLRVRDWSFFPRVLFSGDIGFGETYADGVWSSDDLPEVMRFFAENMNQFDDRRIPWTKIVRAFNIVKHRFRSNSKRGSKKNITAHYDLGNDLFERFLDERLVYSCAVYERSEDSLEQAQLNKLRKILDKAKVKAEHHILEIGGGWGAFAVEAAKQTGCRVTTVTLSPEQHRAALDKVRAEGLSERIEVLLCDYRDIEGQFDRIISIEMLEAVGHERLGLFFERCDQLLKPDGIVAVQFISVPDHKYDEYRRGCDWIQKYVFPGGICPSVSAVCSAAANRSPLVVEHIENIGPNYARTLKEWRERFKARSEELFSLGYDERFQRMWEYYLSYCEAGFASRYLGTIQMVLTRPLSKALPLCPGYQ